MDNKKPTKSFLAKLGGLLAVGAAAGGLFIFSHSWADNPQDDAAFTCASAVNVMDCIKQTGTGVNAPLQEANITSIPINSQALGFTGPVSVGLRYDNYLAWILDVGYAQAYKNAAAAFKLSAGLNERRANVTLGYAITPKQQIKLTYEYLAQNLPFDYASGTVNQWVSQNALGGAYQYMLDNGIVRALEIYGNYTKAQSKELSTVEMYTDNILTQLDYRRIAGGTQTNTGVNVTLTPLKGTILKVGAGYSSLSFDTKWENNDANAVLAYNADVSQLLTPTLMVGAGIGTTAAGSTYTAKVSKILPWSLEASLMGQYTASTEGIPGATTVTAGLSYPAPKTYTNVFSQSLSDLKSWVQTPVIYNTRVLAKAEEKLVQVKITAPASLPSQSFAVGGELTPINTKDYFSFDPAAYDKITYTIVSIAQKGVPNTTFPPSSLNIEVVPVGSYDATLQSSAGMPVTGLTPGQYTLTLQAQGYYQGQAVTTTKTTLDFTVSTDSSLPNPTWNPNAKLTPANVGSTYSMDLKTLVNDTSNIPGGDAFAFTVDSMPESPSIWLTISSDGKSLITLPNSTVPISALPTTHIVLHGTSMASGKPIIIANSNPQSPDGKYDLIVNQAGVAPTWKDNSSNLPDASYGLNYVDSKGANISLSNSIASNGVDNTTKNLTYNCTDVCSTIDQNTQQLGTGGNNTNLTLNKNTGAIIGTPNNTNLIGNSFSFTVVATNTSLKSSAPQTFTIQFTGGQSKVSWKTDNSGNAVSLAQASSLSSAPNYNEPLSNYIVSSDTNDQLTFTKIDAGTCGWISLKDGALTGHPTEPPQTDQRGDCTLGEIDGTSKISGPFKFTNTSNSPLKITTVGSITQQNPISTVAYQQTGYTQDFSKGDKTGPFWDGDVNDTFSIASVAIPTGMNINSSNTTLQGTPTNVDDIGTALKLTVTSKLHGNPDKSPYVVPYSFIMNNFVTTNPSLTVRASWKSGITLPPAINGVPYNPNIPVYPTYMDMTTTSGQNVVTDKISLYSIQRTDSTKCPWLTIDSKGGTFGSSQNPATGQDCQFSLTVTSQATGQPIPLAGTQTITVANGPIWHIFTLPNTAMYYNDSSFPAAGIVVSEANGWVSPQVPPLSAIYQGNKDTSDTPWLTVNPTTNPPIATITAKSLNDNSFINYIQSGCDQNNAATSKYSITLSATDASSGSTPTQQSFTTCLAPNPNLALATKINQDLPPIKVNTNYNDGKGVIINPYTNGDETYLSQTTTADGKSKVADKLTFSPMTIISGCDGFSLSPDGVLTGSAQSTVHDCNFQLTFSSLASNKTSTFSVTIKVATYVLPTWKRDLPDATNGQAYESVNSNKEVVTLDPNTTTVAPYLSQTTYGGTPDTTDTYTYQLDSSKNTCTSNNTVGATSWLSVDSTGKLSGTPPYKADTTCTAAFIVHSNHADQDAYLSKPIKATGVGAVTWADNSQPITVNYSTTPTFGSTYVIPAANLIKSDSTNVTFGNIQISKNIPSGTSDTTGIVKAFDTANKGIDVVPQLQDINNDPANTTQIGTFTIDATPPNGVISTSGQFKVQITANLVNPTIPNGTMTLASAPVGQQKTYTIDPYSSTPSGTITKTKVNLYSGGTVDLTYDKLHFEDAQYNCTSWTASLGDDGTLTVTPPATNTPNPTCTVTFSIRSEKNNSQKTTNLQLTVSADATAPLFTNCTNSDTNNGCSVQTPIQFDDTTTKLELNTLVQSGSTVPGLTFAFSNGRTDYDSSGNWQITSTHVEGDPDGYDRYYLQRIKNANFSMWGANSVFDARLFKDTTSPAIDIATIIAKNIAGTSADNNRTSNLKITLNRDANLGFCSQPFSNMTVTVGQTSGATQRIYTSPSANGGIPVTNNLLYSCRSSDQTPVYGDIITMDYANGGLPGVGNPMILYSFDSQNKACQNWKFSNITGCIAYIEGGATGSTADIVIPANLLGNTYDPDSSTWYSAGGTGVISLPNLNSSARGAAIATFKISSNFMKVYAYPQIKSATSTDFPFDGGSPLNLNGLITNTPLINTSDLNFKLTNPPSQSWLITPGAWTLDRQTINGFWDAGDVGTSPTLNIAVSSTQQDQSQTYSNQTATVPANVKPDKNTDRIKFYWKSGNPWTIKSTGSGKQCYSNMIANPNNTSSDFNNSNLASYVLRSGVKTPINNDRITMLCNPGGGWGGNGAEMKINGVVVAYIGGNTGDLYNCYNTTLVAIDVNSSSIGLSGGTTSASVGLNVKNVKSRSYGNLSSGQNDGLYGTDPNGQPLNDLNDGPMLLKYDLNNGVNCQ